MKKSYILNIIIIVIFCCTGPAFSDNGKGDSGHGKRDKKPQYQQHPNTPERSDHRVYPDSKKHHENYRRDNHDGRPDYHKFHGYSARPYQKHRHYAYYHHKGHRYDYKGHWRSWKEWDSYAKSHPEIHKHGGYYREDAHLMFRFLDPITGGYFFFSIGR